ncbi:MAG: hypothetical protein PVG71_06775 [Anaerolineae bacterium]|jgi:hypothetical protein
MSAGTLAVVELEPHDDLASLRFHLDAAGDGRVALILPWDIPFLSRELDYELLRRETRLRHLEVAIVSLDPERRQLANGCGFPTFVSAEAARSAGRWNQRQPERADPPPRYWWQEEVDLRRGRARPRPTWLDWITQAVRFAAFILVIFAVAGTAYTIIPTAEITLVPAGETLTVRVSVSVDPGVESVQPYADGTGGTIPSRRIGLEVDGNAEVGTTGIASVTSGRATGEVLFTSILAQDYVVPEGTVMRTSSTSYPIRFRTTADVVVPANGQARAPIVALDQRTGNVGAFQINRVEGVAGSAVRVINPDPTTGADPKEVPVVVQADYDRVREFLTQELLDKAYVELHGLLEPNEFLAFESLRVESVPKKAYTHFIGEQTEMVGLNMRLLVSGQAVDIDSAEGIAYQALTRELSSGHRLVDVDFEIGELEDDDTGPGWFTFHVTGRGYAAAVIDPDQVVEQIRGQRVADARAQLQAELPLAEPPEFVIWPEWPERLKSLERVPLLPLRIDLRVTPQFQEVEDAMASSSGRRWSGPLERARRVN